MVPGASSNWSAPQGLRSWAISAGMQYRPQAGEFQHFVAADHRLKLARIGAENTWDVGVDLAGIGTRAADNRMSEPPRRGSLSPSLLVLVPWKPPLANRGGADSVRIQGSELVVMAIPAAQSSLH